MEGDIITIVKFGTQKNQKNKLKNKNTKEKLKVYNVYLQINGFEQLSILSKELNQSMLRISDLVSVAHFLVHGSASQQNQLFGLKRRGFDNSLSWNTKCRTST